MDLSKMESKELKSQKTVALLLEKGEPIYQIRSDEIAMSPEKIAYYVQIGVVIIAIPIILTLALNIENCILELKRLIAF